MLFNFQSNKLRKQLLVGGALCAASFGFFACSDRYSLDEDQPSGLNTLYGYMEDAKNYKNFLQLIDDLGEKENLAKQASRTLFIADDDAFADFFKSNKWGVTSYDQLTLTQKKLILKASMIDNPYPISLMSSVQGPIEGECMRRTSSLQAQDSVLVVRTDDPELPNTSYWTDLALDHDTIVLFKDATSAPMIHFLPRFLAQNMILSTDVDFLYNDPKGTRKSDDAYVNDCKITEANIFCKNGFLHKVNKVMLPLDNMAEVIRKNPNSRQYSELIERFAAPFYDYNLTEDYNRIHGTHLDSVFQKSYFSNRSSKSSGTTSTILQTDKNGNPVEAVLKYDPGWNRYQPGTILDQTRDEVMEDMACMIVPTDSALDEWWNNGGGKVLKDNYGTWDKVPNKVVKDLIKNNQLMSFVASVPSKFNSVLNDAGDLMRAEDNKPIDVSHIDRVELACNGAVYYSNTVFAPTTYSSVMFPTLVTESMSIIYNAIDVLNFDAYLNSMVSRYSFFIPLNEGMLTYLDPVSLTQTKTQLWKFQYDPKGKDKYARVKAVCFDVVDTDGDGVWEETGDSTVIVGANGNAVYDRLEDILDNIIVIGEVQPGKHYYQTKGKNYIKVDGNINVAGEMQVWGGWQLEADAPETVLQVYNMTNGKAYVVNTPTYPAYHSVSDVLYAYEELDDNGEQEFSKFYEILQESGALSRNTNSTIGWTSVSPRGNLIYIPTDKNSSVNYLLNTYHYTIYAPTNAAMDEAFAMGLPTLDMIEEAEAIDEDDSTVVVVPNALDPMVMDTIHYADIVDSAAHLRKVLLDFVKYHIQDNSIFVDLGFDNGRYETAKTNPTTGRSFKLTVSTDGTDLTVEGVNSPAQKVNKSKMYNQIIREDWIKSSQIETASSVVMHAIDHPLLYKYKVGTDLSLPENNQFIYSPNDIYTEEEENAVKKRK